MNQIDIVRLIKRISDRWYILAALMIIGGLSGMLISQTTPSVYESSAVFSVTIDYTQTGALTDIQEDQAMRGVGSVIFSDQVITKTLAQINDENGIELNQSDFIGNSFLDREEFRWTLRYRDPDPQNAKAVVNLWANNANSAIQEGLKHSLASSVLLDTLSKMKTCLQELSNGNEKSNCGNIELETLINSISDLSNRIQIKKAASLGLFNSLSVSLVNEGVVSQAAVLGQRNLLVISGALIGFFLSIIAISIDVKKRSPSI